MTTRVTRRQALGRATSQILLLLLIAMGLIGSAVLPAVLRGAAHGGSSVVTVRVEFGDTLWTIARRHTPPGESVQTTVATLQHLNSIRPEALRPGTTLKVPCPDEPLAIAQR